MTTADDANKVKQAVQRSEPTAENIEVVKAIGDFLNSAVYYVTFESDEYDASDCFYYAFVRKDGDVELYENGVETIKELKSILDTRRNILQRLGDFSLFETIAALIAVAVTATFIILSISQRELNQQFLAIFGIVIGYYFGKNTVGK